MLRTFAHPNLVASWWDEKRISYGNSLFVSFRPTLLVPWFPYWDVDRITNRTLLVLKRLCPKKVIGKSYGCHNVTSLGFTFVTSLMTWWFEKLPRFQIREQKHNSNSRSISSPTMEWFDKGHCCGIRIYRDLDPNIVSVSASPCRSVCSPCLCLLLAVMFFIKICVCVLISQLCFQTWKH